MKNSEVHLQNNSVEILDKTKCFILNIKQEWLSEESNYEVLFEGGELKKISDNTYLYTKENKND